VNHVQKSASPRAEKNLPLIFTDDADLKGIAVIAVIADIGNLKTQRLTTDFSDLKQKKTTADLRG